VKQLVGEGDPRLQHHQPVDHRREPLGTEPHRGRLLAHSEPGPEEGDEQGERPRHDQREHGEDPPDDRDLREQERRGDQGTEDQDRGELEQLAHQLAELLELVAEPRARRGHGHPGRERAEEEVRVGSGADREHQQCDAHRDQRLLCLDRGEERERLELEHDQRDHHADHQAEHDLLGELPTVGVGAAGERQQDEDDG